MSGFIDAYMSVFSFLGLASPFKRFLLGTTLGFATQLVFKPSISYDSKGNAKSFLSQTFVPWYLFAIIPGVIAALFL